WLLAGLRRAVRTTVRRRGGTEPARWNGPGPRHRVGRGTGRRVHRGAPRPYPLPSGTGPSRGHHGALHARVRGGHGPGLAGTLRAPARVCGRRRLSRRTLLDTVFRPTESGGMDQAQAHETLATAVAEALWNEDFGT